MDFQLRRSADGNILRSFQSSDALGVLIGLGILGPLLGQFVGIPSRYLADFAVVLAVAIFWMRPELRGEAPSRLLWVVAPLAAYFVLVVASARSSQWVFLLHPGMWSGHADDYADSKLLMFLVTFIGPVLSALLLTLSASRGRVANAALWTVLALGLIAMARLATFADVLIDTPVAVSGTFFLDADRGFSVLSYGLLFLLAGIVSLFLPRTKLLSAVFLAACFNLHRRTETITLLLAILAYYANSGLLQQRRRDLVTGAATIVLAAILIIEFHNGGSLRSWTMLGSAAEGRVSIASAAADGVGPAGSVWSMLFGQGLGSAETTLAQWPHNLPLETYIESGSLALLALIAVLATSTIILRRARILADSGSALCAAALGTAVLLFSLKASDATSAGLLFAWALVTVALALEAPPFRQIAAPVVAYPKDTAGQLGLAG